MKHEPYDTTGYGEENGTFPMTSQATSSDIPCSSKVVNGDSADLNNNPTTSKHDSANDSLINRHLQLVQYLSADDNAPSTSKPQTVQNTLRRKEHPTKRKERTTSLSPSNPCLQQEISEEIRSARIDLWVQDQLEQRYEDNNPPMGFDDVEENSANGGHSGSDHASQQSTVSAGISGW